MVFNGYIEYKTSEETINLMRLLDSEDADSIQLAFTLMSSFEPDLSDPIFMARFKEIINKNKVNRHLAALFGYSKFVSISRISDEWFRELSQKLPPHLYDNSPQSKYSALKLWCTHFKNLHTLDIRSSQLENLPDEVYDLKNLKKLMVCNNPISRLSSKIANLTKLEEIGFCAVSTQFFIPAEIEQLKDTLKSACINMKDYQYKGIDSLGVLKQKLPNTKFH